ncbi:Protein of unknown function [Cotesia congregata]|uniref:Uncharacterized protein n=1 Tax=Cotesia congregata TaxID=51543 RepID=A0A8J2HHX5_COTCN|nr:Protein of unknown function [Cotesia congregata]
MKFFGLVLFIALFIVACQGQDTAKDDKINTGLYNKDYAYGYYNRPGQLGYNGWNLLIKMKFIWTVFIIAALIVLCQAQGFNGYGNRGRGENNGYGNQGRGGYDNNRGRGGYDNGYGNQGGQGRLDNH